LAGHPSPSKSQNLPYRIAFEISIPAMHQRWAIGFWPFLIKPDGRPFAPLLRMSSPMRTVYVLKNGYTPPLLHGRHV
jgi:hypothetical protein